MMKAAVAVLVAIVVGAAAILAAPQTAQPGQMTQARVWIQNRGRAEAIPVDLREVNLEAPLPVRVVAPTRQQWEYDTIRIRPEQNVAALLNERGAAGWEAVAVVFTTDNEVTLLLKRPRV